MHVVGNRGDEQGADEYGDEEWATLVGARVCVTLADGEAASGLLLGVDPETRHVALAQAVDSDGDSDGHGDEDGDGGRVRLSILMRHCVRHIARDGNAPAADALLAALGLDGDAEPRHIEDEEAIVGRARRLAAFLDRHLVPNEMVAGSTAAAEIRLFGGAATLLAPFRDPDVCVASENEQLVRQLRPLLARFVGEEEQVDAGGVGSC